MFCLTCTTLSSVELARYGVSRAKDWVSGDCDTISILSIFRQCHVFRMATWQDVSPF